MVENQLIHPEIVRTEVIELDKNPNFVVSNGVDHTTETLAKGYAVDSIFHQASESGHLRELRVWFRDGILMTSPGIPLSELTQ